VQRRGEDVPSSQRRDPTEDAAVNGSGMLKRLKRVGPEVLGGLAGAGMELLLPGLGGSLTGAATGPAVAAVVRGVRDVSQRQLSEWEGKRIERVAYFAIRRIADNNSHRFSLRQDGFFGDRPDDRSAATEILEGVIRAAQQEYQEKKIPFYGNLLGNVPFHPEIDPAQAVALLKLGERLSYRQLCLIALLLERDRYGLADTSYTFETTTDGRTIGLIQDAVELRSIGLLPTAGATYGDPGPMIITPLHESVTQPGRQLYQLMNLSELDTTDIEGLAKALRPPV
jgi:hypothetical protein